MFQGEYLYLLFTQKIFKNVCEKGFHFMKMTLYATTQLYASAIKKQKKNIFNDKKYVTFKRKCVYLLGKLKFLQYCHKITPLLLMIQSMTYVVVIEMDTLKPTIR